MLAAACQQELERFAGGGAQEGEQGLAFLLADAAVAELEMGKQCAALEHLCKSGCALVAEPAAVQLEASVCGGRADLSLHKPDAALLMAALVKLKLNLLR